MSLVPWKPFSDLDRFFGDDDWFMPIFPKAEMSKPAMDVYETEKAVVAEVSIPDFDPEKVEVSVEDGVLRITGKTEDKKEEKDKGYWHKEIRRGSFERMVRLPVAVKEETVDATYEKGILKVIMPKVEAKSKPKVQIKVKEK